MFKEEILIYPMLYYMLELNLSVELLHGEENLWTTRQSKDDR